MLRTSPFRYLPGCALLLALGVLAFATPRVCGAQTSAADTARATERFKLGKAAFAKDNMPEAERLFAEAFALRKSPDIAANLGQAQLEQQKYRLAAEHLQWALANLLPSATDAQRKAIETGLGRARAEVAMVRLDIKPDGSDVLLGEQHLGKSPIAGGVYVDPGEVIVSVKHDGFVALDKRVFVAKGTEQAVEISLSASTQNDPGPVTESPPSGAVGSGLERSGAASQAPAATADRGSQKSLVPAFVATGVAVASGVAGLVLELSASSKASDADAYQRSLAELNGASLDGVCGGAVPASGCDALKDRRKSVDRSRNFAIGAFVVGGVAALAAGYFYWDALAHRGAASSARQRPLLAFMPSLWVGREALDDGASLESVKLSVTGKF